MSDSAPPRGGGSPGRGPLRLCHLDPSAAEHPVATARRRARAALLPWDVGTALAEDTVLVVCELVANATMHAGGATSLDLLSLDDSALRVEVTDNSRATPMRRPPNRGQPGGLGLMIVQTLCRSWGTLDLPQGKTVWAELTGTPRGPARGGAAPGPRTGL